MFYIYCGLMSAQCHSDICRGALRFHEKLRESGRKEIEYKQCIYCHTRSVFEPTKRRTQKREMFWPDD